MKTKISCPELTLPPRERRKRARHMARLRAGCNAITRRQIRHLPSAKRKEGRMLRRFMKKQGQTSADLTG